jgi:hypothetical protein
MSNLENKGWVILVKSGNGRWRIGWDAIFSSKASAEQFVRSEDWVEQTKVVRGSINASVS